MLQEFESAGMETKPLGKEGNMQKLSRGALKRWQTRYFCLSSTHLNYFINATDAHANINLKGSIFLRDVISCDIVDVRTATLQLQLADDARTDLKMRGKTVLEALDWQECINAAIGAKKANLHATGGTYNAARSRARSQAEDGTKERKKGCRFDTHDEVKQGDETVRVKRPMSKNRANTPGCLSCCFKPKSKDGRRPTYEMRPKRTISIDVYKDRLAAPLLDDDGNPM